MAKAKGLPALTYGADKAGLVRGGPFAPLVDVTAPEAGQDFGLVVANKAGLTALDLAGKPVKLKAGEKLHTVCAPVWGSKPEPPKIPSADQRGLSRARSMG